MRRLIGLSLLGLLTAACVPATGSAVSSGPPGPWDGTYTGPITSTGAAGCRSSGENRTLTVTGGTGRILYNPTTQLSATGPVTAEGAVNLANTAGDTRITGRIVGTRFTGTFNSATCQYAFNFTRQG